MTLMYFNDYQVLNGNFKALTLIFHMNSTEFYLQILTYTTLG